MWALKVTVITYTFIFLYIRASVSETLQDRDIVTMARMWSLSRHLGLETHQRLVSVSSLQKLQRFGLRRLTSRSCFDLGYLHLVLKMLFCPNFAGHINN